jgi:hypothetical protein
MKTFITLEALLDLVNEVAQEAKDFGCLAHSAPKASLSNALNELLSQQYALQGEVARLKPLCQQDAGPLYTEVQLKRAVRDALEEASQAAVDAVAFNGGPIQTEAHVREAIRALIKEIGT